MVLLKRYSGKKVLPLSSTDEMLIFQDHSAPCHRSHLVSEFKERSGIRSLYCPGNSPDLNPIENLWGIIKSKIGRNLIKNKDLLREKIRQVWQNEISDEIVENLIMSMPRIIMKCIRNKGYYTKY